MRSPIPPPPAVDADGVYAYFGANGTVVSLDHAGKIRWQKDVGAFKTNNDFGTGSSVAISNGKIFVQVLTEESSKIVCFDTKSGNQKWSRQRGGKGSSWSTPVVWKNEKREELVVSGGMQISSYDLRSGETLWKLDKVKSPTACSVAADDNKIYFGGSDPMSKGPLFAMSAGATGEIKPKRTNQTFDYCVWRNPRSAPGMSSPISNGDVVYVVDRSVLRSYDAETGEEKFDKQRLPGLKMVVACPVIVGDELVLIDEYGKMGAVKVGAEFSYRQLGSIEDTVWASPAVTKNAILVRGVNGLYCIGR
jgi:outer membrane protein assembly factor BamB